MNSFTEVVQSKTTEELLAAVYEFDRWSPEMLNSVEKELASRNALPADIAIRKQEMIEAEETQMLEGKKAGLMGQAIGWLTVFGLLGIAIGYIYAFSKVNSKYSDRQYFKYNDSSRRNGRHLFYASLLLSGTAIIYKLITFRGTVI